MKILFLYILASITLFANTIECESVLTLFDKSVKQEKPISDALLMMTIVYCEDVVQYRQVLAQMMHELDSADIQTF